MRCVCVRVSLECDDERGKQEKEVKPKILKKTTLCFIGAFELFFS